jgi:2-dehydropantoate 2-reductase
VNIAVLGPGGVGGLVAAALARASARVVVVARASTATTISTEGVRVESVLLGDFVAHPRAVARLREPVDVLIVATKAAGLAEALERVEATPRLVLPLLNGLDHLAVLRERFGEDPVVAGTIRVEADRPEPGVVVHTSKFLRVDMASHDPAMRAPMLKLAGTLTAAGVPARVYPPGDLASSPAERAEPIADGAESLTERAEPLAERAEPLAKGGEPPADGGEAQVMWSKLVRLNALACTTSAFDKLLGEIRSTPELRVELVGAIEEGCKVAHAEGAWIPSGDPLGELTAAHDTLGSSMQRDIAAGRLPELDAIPGSVLRAAARHGIECPTIERLVAMIAARAGIPPPGVP